MSKFGPLVIWENSDLHKLIRLRHTEKLEWKKIAKRMPGRTWMACRVRYMKYCKEIGLQPIHLNKRLISRRCDENVRFAYNEAKRQNFTWEELSKKSGVDDGTIQDWFYKARPPDYPNLKAVMQVLEYKLTPERIKK